MMRYITKSRVGLFLGIFGWVLFIFVMKAVAEDFAHDIEGSSPSPETKNNVFKALFGFYSAIALCLTSLVLATLGFKNERWISIITYTLHALFIGGMIAASTLAFYVENS